jgi:hypothetical protein
MASLASSLGGIDPLTGELIEPSTDIFGFLSPAAPAPAFAPASPMPAPSMPASSSGLSSFETAISGLSSLAAPWFTSITGQSVIPVPTSAAQAALQQTQIQQQAQAKLLQTQPTTAGLLANPTLILVGVGIFGLLFYMMSQNK